MATQFLIFLAFLSLLSFSSPLSTETILSAANVLSTTGYNSMSLILEFGSRAIIPPSQSLTIFSPVDSAFSESGQPSLSLLRFHFSPLSLSMHSLKSLPPGTKIPTLLANHSIIVTSAVDKVSLNGVRVNGSVLYDDGSLIIFGTDKFLDPDFEVSGSIDGMSIHSFGCPAVADKDSRSFEETSRVLRSRGYSVMASFLDMQVAEFKDETRLTIFAPPDEAIVHYLGNLSECRSIFLRYLVPCKISKIDMLSFDDGIVLPSLVEGFMINVGKSGDTLLPKIAYPDMYGNDWLVVHGLLGSLTETQSPSVSKSISFNITAVDVVLVIAFYMLLN